MGKVLGGGAALALFEKIEKLEAKITESLRCNQGYRIVIPVLGASIFKFQGRFNGDTSYNYRQSIKIFGTDNGIAIDGILTILSNSGECIWSGNGEITATSDANGVITVLLPMAAYDKFTLISADIIQKVN